MSKIQLRVYTDFKKGMLLMKLETPRLILREFSMEDLDTFYELMADPEVMRFSLNGPWKSKEEAREKLQKLILDNYKKYGYGIYAVIDKVNHQLAGYCGFFNQLVDDEEFTELGYRFHTKYWGKGLATEAGLALREYAFNTLLIPRLISIIDPNNIRSIAVAKRVGLHYWKNSLYGGIPVSIYTINK